MTELKCQFHGDPQPSVSWLKNGQPIIRDPDFDVRIRASSSTLTIYYPTYDHQGHKFTFSFDDIGEVPKVFRELENISCSDGQTVILECIILGEPAPKVKWFQNKTQLAPDDRISIERDGDNIALEIQNIAKGDQGEYICEAVNYNVIQNLEHPGKLIC
uniref:Ig-like domain-containing protein n=1 Tax=Pygocentrus nattereri TaxID=42514 RepID=A0AAR2KJJ3_PYGNA